MLDRDASNEVETTLGVNTDTLVETTVTMLPLLMMVAVVGTTTTEVVVVPSTVNVLVVLVYPTRLVVVATSDTVEYSDETRADEVDTTASLVVKPVVETEPITDETPVVGTAPVVMTLVVCVALELETTPELATRVDEEDPIADSLVAETTGVEVAPAVVLVTADDNSEELAPDVGTEVT